MNRRRYLGAVATTGLLAGCLDSIGDSGDENAVLGPPDQDLSATSHPSYGDQLPTLTLEDPLAEREISTDDFVGERAFLLTFIYSNCHDDSCPLLLSRLAHAQQAAQEEGVSDEVAFLAKTFDPERDTADVLQSEGDRQGVDYDLDNWHFLRPEDFEEASSILSEQFGLELARDDLEAHGHEDHGTDDEESDDEEYDIAHYNLILLVNKDGYVERAYPNATSIEWDVITDDLLTVASV